jgi:hypothetical protein
MAKVPSAEGTTRDGDRGMTTEFDGKPTSQDHGKALERVVRDSGRFPGAIGSKSSETDAIDIEARYDEVLDLYTSVKATGDGWIGLADAIRFYEIDRPFRIIAGEWKQTTPTMKTFPILHEMIVTMKTLTRMHDRIGLDRIREMHAEYASYEAGPIGKAEAKKAATRMTKQCAHLKGLVRLDFKGDDKGQRRLQLSVKLIALINAVKDDPNYVHKGLVVPTYLQERSWYHAVPLPIEVQSTVRRFSDPDMIPQIGMDVAAPQVLAADPDRILTTRPLRRQDDAARRAAAAIADPAQRRLIA